MSKLLVLLSITAAFTPDLIAQPGVSTTTGWSEEVNYLTASISPWRDELVSYVASVSPTKAASLCTCEQCDQRPTDGEPCTCESCGVTKDEAPATTIVMDGKTYSKRVHTDGSITYTPVASTKSVSVSRGQVYSVSDGYVVPMMQLAPAVRCHIDAYGNRVCR